MGAYQRVTVEVSTESVEAMQRSVAEGRYESPDEIIDLALRDWREAQSSNESKLLRLRQMIEDGDRSGPSIPAEQVYAHLEEVIASFDKPR